MVEMASSKFVCIVDDSKLVDGLGGSKLAMPVEIVQFCHKYTLQRLQVGGGVAPAWVAWARPVGTTTRCSGCRRVGGWVGSRGGFGSCECHGHARRVHRWGQ